MKSITLLLTLLISTFSFADAWDNLTHEEATNLVSYLEVNPYIFDYCDCCQGHDDEDNVFQVELMKVTRARIIACSWEPSMYSVEYDFEPIASINYQEDGSGFHVMPASPAMGEESPVIYMNYTWGYNAKTRQARPIFESVEYHYAIEYGERSCNEPFKYPSPKSLREVGKFSDYKKWYKKAKAGK